MSDAKNKVVQAAGRVAEAALHTTETIVDKSREAVDRLTLEKRLKRVQRQLGILTYTLQKSGEENPALVSRYVEEIDKLRRQLSAFATPPKTSGISVHKCSGCGAGVTKDAMFCGRCGEKLPEK